MNPSQCPSVGIDLSSHRADSALRRLAAALQRFGRRWDTARRRRLDLQALMQLSDDQLRDIGLLRSQIRQKVAQRHGGSQ